MEDYAPIYFPPKSEYWTPTPSKDVELYEKPTKRTIDIGFKRRKKDFLNKFIKKDKIENYYPIALYLDETNLKRYLGHINKIIKVEEKFGQTKLLKNKSKFFLFAYKYKTKNKKNFIFYLTRTQIKEIKNMEKIKKL